MVKRLYWPHAVLAESPGMLLDGPVLEALGESPAVAAVVQRLDRPVQQWLQSVAVLQWLQSPVWPPVVQRLDWPVQQWPPPHQLFAPPI